MAYIPNVLSDQHSHCILGITFSMLFQALYSHCYFQPYILNAITIPAMYPPRTLLGTIWRNSGHSKSILQMGFYFSKNKLPFQDPLLMYWTISQLFDGILFGEDLTNVIVISWSQVSQILVKVKVTHCPKLVN